MAEQVNQEEQAIRNCIVSVIGQVLYITNDYPEIIFTMIKQDRLPKPSEVPGSNGWRLRTMQVLQEFFPDLVQPAPPENPEPVQEGEVNGAE